MYKLAPSILIAFLVGCTSLPSSQPLEIVPAKVVSTLQQDDKGNWVVGATLGAAAGLISGQGHGTESKLIRTAGGAGVGVLASHLLAGRKKNTVVVLQDRSGVIYEIEHVSSEFGVGDCVLIHRRSQYSTTMHRANSSQCYF